VSPAPCSTTACPPSSRLASVSAARAAPSSANGPPPAWRSSSSRASPWTTRGCAIRNHLGPPDITAPVRESGDTSGLTDLSAIDFEKLAEAFLKAPKTTTETLREKAEAKVKEMAERNPTRVDLVEKLEALVDAYNTASGDVADLFDKLKAFVRELAGEEARAGREGLSEDELAIFDLLTKPEPKLTKAQETEVKKAARELLAKLQDSVAVFQWGQRQQTRAAVRSLIEVVLNTLPEEPYPEELWHEKVEATWAFVLSRYGSSGHAGGSLGLS
jgi:type I restriction enzyme R subunit